MSEMSRHAARLARAHAKRRHLESLRPVYATRREAANNWIPPEMLVIGLFGTAMICMCPLLFVVEQFDLDWPWSTWLLFFCTSLVMAALPTTTLVLVNHLYGMRRSLLSAPLRLPLDVALYGGVPLLALEVGMRLELFPGPRLYWMAMVVIQSAICTRYLIGRLGLRGLERQLERTSQQITWLEGVHVHEGSVSLCDEGPRAGRLTVSARQGALDLSEEEPDTLAVSEKT